VRRTLFVARFSRHVDGINDERSVVFEIPQEPGCCMSDPKESTGAASDRQQNIGHLVFHVFSIEKTDAPGPGQGKDWYRYVLKNDTSTITGVRQGTRQLVREYADEYAEQLNTRIKFGPATWSPRGRKPGRPPST